MPSPLQNIQTIKELSAKSAENLVPQHGTFSNLLYSAKSDAIAAIAAQYCREHKLDEDYKNSFIDAVSEEYNIDTFQVHKAVSEEEKTKFRQYLKVRFFIQYIEELAKSIHLIKSGTPEEIKEDLERTFKIPAVNTDHDDFDKYSFFYDNIYNSQGWKLKANQDINLRCRLIEILEERGFIEGYTKFFKENEVEGYHIIIFDKIYSRTQIRYDYSSSDINGPWTELQKLESECAARILKLMHDILHINVNNAHDFDDLLRILTNEQRHIAFEILEDKLQGFYSQNSANPTLGFKQIVQHLSLENRSKFLNRAEIEIKEHLLSSQASGDRLLNLEMVLFYLNHEEIKQILTGLPIGRFIYLLKEKKISLTRIFELLPVEQRNSILSNISDDQLAEILSVDMEAHTVEEFFDLLSFDQLERVKALEAIQEYQKNKNKLSENSSISKLIYLIKEHWKILSTVMGRLSLEKRNRIFGFEQNKGLQEALDSCIEPSRKQEFIDYLTVEIPPESNVSRLDTGFLSWIELGKILKHLDEAKGLDLLVALQERQIKILPYLEGVENLPRVLSRLTPRQISIIFEAINGELLKKVNSNFKLLKEILAYFTSDQVAQFYTNNKKELLNLASKAADPAEVVIQIARYLPETESLELLNHLPAQLEANQASRLIDALPLDQQKELIKKKYPSGADASRREYLFKYSSEEKKRLPNFANALQTMRSAAELHDLLEKYDEETRNKSFNNFISDEQKVHKLYYIFNAAISKNRAGIVDADGRAQAFKLILQHLSSTNRMKVYEKLKHFLPHAINTLSDLQEVVVFLSREQRTEIFNAIKMHMSVLLKKGFVLGQGVALIDTAKLLDKEQRDFISSQLLEHWHEIIEQNELVLQEKELNDRVIGFCKAALDIMDEAQKNEFLSLHGTTLGSIDNAHSLAGIMAPLNQVQRDVVFAKVMPRLLSILQKRYNQAHPDPLDKEKDLYKRQQQKTTGAKLNALFRVLSLEQCQEVCAVLKEQSLGLLKNIDDFAVLMSGLEAEKAHVILTTFGDHFFKLLENYLASWHDDSLNVASDELKELLSKLHTKFEAIYHTLREGQPALFKTNFLEKIKGKPIAEALASLDQHLQKKTKEDARSRVAWKLAVAYYGKEFDEQLENAIGRYCAEHEGFLRSYGENRKNIVHCTLFAKAPQTDKEATATSTTGPSNA